jgi:superfamily I DNA and RNA helicase
VIAGAGSGKTNTLAHRVAHLIVKGADPRRILLMTFSRRAAAEMTKRVERISRKAMGEKAGVMTDALTWAGTFHGIGIGHDRCWSSITDGVRYGSNSRCSYMRRSIVERLRLDKFAFSQMTKLRLVIQKVRAVAPSVPQDP